MIHPSVEQFTKAMTFAGVTNCPQDGRWEIPTDSDICTEVETIALVFGFVRALRPKVVVETGSNVGCMTHAIVEALAANGGEGLLVTCDTNAEFLQAAWSRCGDDPTERSRRLMHFSTDGLWVVEHYSDADLYFIDSSDSSRMAELHWLRDHGKKGAVVLTHDTNLIGHVTEVVRTLPNWVLLPGPRGLGIATL